MKLCKSVVFLLCVPEIFGRQYKESGRSNMSPKIVNGIDVPIAEYPYLALIMKGNLNHCGGSVISRRVILTAAHCFYYSLNQLYPPSVFKVYLGSSTSQKGVAYDVCKLHPHERYMLNSVEHDIGLMVLTNKIKFTPLIKKAKVAPTDEFKNPNSFLTVAGFGITETGDQSNKLKSVTMRYVSRNNCNSSQFSPMLDNIPLPPHMFCMIGDKWSGDCFGDSGGPVTWKSYIVGVVSIGRDAFCASDMMPSMYTDLTFFNVWINSTIHTLEAKFEKICDSNKKFLRVNETPLTKDIVMKGNRTFLSFSYSHFGDRKSGSHYDNR